MFDAIIHSETLTLLNSAFVIFVMTTGLVGGVSFLYKRREEGRQKRAASIEYFLELLQRLGLMSEYLEANNLDLVKLVFAGEYSWRGSWSAKSSVFRGPISPKFKEVDARALLLFLVIQLGERPWFYDANEALIRLQRLLFAPKEQLSIGVHDEERKAVATTLIWATITLT